MKTTILVKEILIGRSAVYEAFADEEKRRAASKGAQIRAQASLNHAT